MYVCGLQVDFFNPFSGSPNGGGLVVKQRDIESTHTKRRSACVFKTGNWFSLHISTNQSSLL
jgi:hypothetical protein